MVLITLIHVFHPLQMCSAGTQTLGSHEKSQSLQMEAGAQDSVSTDRQRGQWEIIHELGDTLVRLPP